jgi:phosphomannomutase
MSERISCFKAYDVRGIVPDELNEDIAYGVGRALSDELNTKNAVIGYDARLSSPSISQALAKGFMDAGVDVTDIGLCGTEMIYFATAFYEYGAGVMITASHNPPQYNGMKFVREDSKPISGDTGLFDVEKRVREKKFERSGKGKYIQKDVSDDFVKHLLNIVSPNELKPLKLLCDAGNGCAGLAVQKLSGQLPLRITEMNFEPDGSFPNGVPNPILPESRKFTEERMRAEKFDFGVAWDGDYDRCFFFDENGNFIEGYYIVGLLAQDVLQHHPGATIIHDPRLIYNTIEIVRKLGGHAVCSKTGHAFIKERMRLENAEYGGEMSAHHYFKAHWYCDSGMIPMLMIARLVSQSGKTLGELVSEMMQNYPCSGEINLKVENPTEAMRKVRVNFSGGRLDETDGVSIEFDNWRFNLRASNTEPVIRLNVESKGDKQLVEEKLNEILKSIES